MVTPTYSKKFTVILISFLLDVREFVYCTAQMLYFFIPAAQVVYAIYEISCLERCASK